MNISEIALATIQGEKGGYITSPSELRDIIPAIKDSGLNGRMIEGAVQVVQKFNRDEGADFLEMVGDYSRGNITIERVSMVAGSILGSINAPGCDASKELKSALTRTLANNASESDTILVNRVVKEHCRRTGYQGKNFFIVSILVAKMLIECMA